MRTSLNFFIVLAAICIIAFSCTHSGGDKTITTPATPTVTPSVTITPSVTPTLSINYTSGMGGVRYWHCVDSANLHIPYNGHDTVIYYNDTFAFTLVNDTVIKRIYPSSSVDSLTYVSTDSAAHTHYFFGIHPSGGWTDVLMVWYNYADNSIVFRSNGSGTGSTWFGQYVRKKYITP